MEKQNNKKVYGPIGDGRLLNIKVILDGEEIYSGMVEDAPDEVKKLKYSEVKIGSQITYLVYSELN